MTPAAGLSLLKIGVVGLALLALTGFVILHLVWYIKPSPIASLADLQARLTSGRPTIVEFYTNL